MAVIYRPKQQYQLVPTDPYGRYNCTAYSGAMAIDRATLGGCLVTGEDVRSRSDEPIPNHLSPGLNVGQVVDVAQGLGVHLTLHRGGLWTALTGALGDGRGVVLAIDYDRMGAYSCQPTFLDFHAIYLNNLSAAGAKVLVYDPLCHEYRFVPTKVVKAAAEKYAAQAGGLYWASTRVTPNISPADQHN